MDVKLELAWARKYQKAPKLDLSSFGAPIDCPKRQRFDRARMVKQSVPDEMSDVKTIKFAHAITI